MGRTPLRPRLPAPTVGTSIAWAISGLIGETDIAHSGEFVIGQLEHKVPTRSVTELGN
jgi:hypothetical protein